MSDESSMVLQMKMRATVKYADHAGMEAEDRQANQDRQVARGYSSTWRLCFATISACRCAGTGS